MKTYRLNSTMTGLLYILGTVGGVLALGIAGNLVTGDDNVARIAAEPSRFTLGTFFILVMGFSLSAMTVFLYPLFRKDSEPLALAMIIFRGALEGVGYITTVILWSVLLVLSNEYTVSNSDSLAVTGEIIIQLTKAIAPIHTFVFIIGAACLYVVFYRTKLIPRWLSGWGLVGAVIYVTVDLLKFFDISHGVDVLYVPLALQEMVMALWLIFRGFNPTALKTLDEAQ